MKDSRLSETNRDIINRGKTIRTLTKELSNVSDKSMPIKICADKKELPHYPMPVENVVEKNNTFLLSCSTKENTTGWTVGQLIERMKTVLELDNEVRFQIQNGASTYSISLVGQEDDCMILYHF